MKLKIAAAVAVLVLAVAGFFCSSLQKLLRSTWSSTLQGSQPSGRPAAAGAGELGHDLHHLHHGRCWRWEGDAGEA